MMGPEQQQQQQQPTAMNSNSLLRMKIVVAASDKNKREARMVNISSAVNFSDIKTAVLNYFPELEKEDHVVGWVDEEGDYITVGSDQELQLALTERKGSVLKILVKIKNEKKKEDEKSPQIQVPRNYFANLRATKQKLSSQGPIVLHQQEGPEKMKRVIKKHPGIIFVGGDLREKLGKKGVDSDKLDVRQTNSEKKSVKDGKKMMVDRIISPQKVLSLLNDYQDSEADSKSLSVMFLPLIPVRKKHHCHVLGSWDDCRMICVAFKRRGQQGQEEATGKMKERKLGKKVTTGSDDRNKEDEKHEMDVQKPGPRIVEKKMMLTKKQRMNKMARPTMEKRNGDEQKKQSNSTVCMVPRKRMKM